MNRDGTPSRADIEDYERGRLVRRANEAEQRWADVTTKLNRAVDGRDRALAAAKELRAELRAHEHECASCRNVLAATAWLDET